MTLFELLSKFSIDELWYILHMRHGYGCRNLSFKAEQTYKAYKRAYEELLSLHKKGNPKNNVLHCEFVTETSDETPPDVYMSCVVLASGEIDEHGKAVRYAMDFIPWDELIDAPVSDESMQKYGMLVCASELLWELTFYGFSAERVRKETDELKELTESVFDAEESTSHETFEWKTSNSSAYAKILVEWLKNAPPKVKKVISDHISADLTDRDENELTQEEALIKLRVILDGSSRKYSEEPMDMLHSMLRGLDLDERYTLLKIISKENFQS